MTDEWPKIEPEKWLRRDGLQQCGGVVGLMPIWHKPSHCARTTPEHQELCNEHISDPRVVELTRLHRHHVQNRLSLLVKLMNTSGLRHHEQATPVLLDEFFTLIENNLWAFRMDREQFTKELLVKKSTFGTLVFYCLKYPQLQPHFKRLYPHAPPLTTFKAMMKETKKKAKFHKLKKRWKKFKSLFKKNE